MANVSISHIAAASGRQLRRPNALGRRVSVSAAAAEAETSTTTMFSDEEWEAAFKRASLIAIEVANSRESTGEEKLDGRFFTEAEWSEAFERAALLYVAPGTSSSDFSGSNPIESVPEGRAFSDEQWNRAFESAAMMTSESSEEALESSSVGMFTEKQWEEAFKIAGGTLPPKKRETAPGYVETVEIVNGRLAMIAFVAAFAAEKAGAGSIAQQFESSMIGVGLTFVLLTVASCISIETVKSKSVGPFQPSAEMLNGRAAMVGFAALLLAEGGSSTFFN